MPVQPSGWIQNHMLLYKNLLDFAQPEMGKRVKSIYYEVYGNNIKYSLLKYDLLTTWLIESVENEWLFYKLTTEKCWKPEFYPPK